MLVERTFTTPAESVYLGFTTALRAMSTRTAFLEARASSYKDYLTASHTRPNSIPPLRTQNLPRMVERFEPQQPPAEIETVLNTITKGLKNKDALDAFHIIFTSSAVTVQNPSNGFIQFDARHQMHDFLPTRLYMGTFEKDAIFAYRALGTKGTILFYRCHPTTSKLLLPQQPLDWNTKGRWRLVTPFQFLRNDTKGFVASIEAVRAVVFYFFAAAGLDRYGILRQGWRKDLADALMFMTTHPMYKSLRKAIEMSTQSSARTHTQSALPSLGFEELSVTPSRLLQMSLADRQLSPATLPTEKSSSGHARTIQALELSSAGPSNRHADDNDTGGLPSVAEIEQPILSPDQIEAIIRTRFPLFANFNPQWKKDLRYSGSYRTLVGRQREWESVYAYYFPEGTDHIPGNNVRFEVVALHDSGTELRYQTRGWEDWFRDDRYGMIETEASMIELMDTLFLRLVTMPSSEADELFNDNHDPGANITRSIGLAEDHNRPTDYTNLENAHASEQVAEPRIHDRLDKISRLLEEQRLDLQNNYTHEELVKMLLHEEAIQRAEKALSRE
ncbi:hypothetical protein BDV96DRAFT_608143 [Lophiotrema nucula]|uniref:Uncharacterized protein n=1 Tax=Lophiotrema nucula TaxID=690887 RepID=A0A6A5YH86_9PLEO|nr:hypothetical protein BDV96DRAFT_608143 [Lophiotrema nucula]